MTAILICIVSLICITLEAPSNKKFNTPVSFNLKDSTITTTK